MTNLRFLSKNVVFQYFLWFFTVVATDFCQISQNHILSCQLWTINAFCIPKLSKITIGFLSQIFVFKRCIFFIIRYKTILHGKHIHYLNIWEGPHNYFSLSNEWLYWCPIFHWEQWFCSFVKLFSSCSFNYVECCHFLP